MIFNKNNNGVEEIHNIVGVAYYANNDFVSIRPHIIDETRTIIKHIGREVYDRAEEHYHSDDFNPNWETTEEEEAETDVIENKLVTLVQTAIALMASFRYNQANIMSHEDTGRKIKIDNDHEKLPWEWMYDRDDAAMLRRAFLAIDNLIDFCETEELTEWIDSEKRTACRSLFISSTAEFDRVYPIDESARFFYILAPFIREAQDRTLPGAMTLQVFTDLQQKYTTNAITDEKDKHLLFLVQHYLPLRTIEIACSRLAVSVFPEGVVQQFTAGIGTSGRHTTSVASDETRREYIRHIGKQADNALDDIKRYIQQITADKLNYPIMPKNSPNNRYFMT
ncbi:MAG: hypothetical protein LBN27_10760 [Prevotellaceae bacterium]|jgi:hypothetical protein|nr:hypothetical protein [Prevotellaceae bacterium]